MIVIYPLFHGFLGQIKDLVNQYMIEASAGQYDYVKALAEFSRYRFVITFTLLIGFMMSSLKGPFSVSSRDESALTFKKGEIIAVVPKHDAYTEKVLVNTCFTPVPCIYESNFQYFHLLIKPVVSQVMMQ